MCDECSSVVRLRDRHALHRLLAVCTSTVSGAEALQICQSIESCGLVGVSANLYPCSRTILCVLISNCRQLVTNCRTGKADEALSFWFLVQWLLGDVTNLIGAVLTRQLATQARERERERESGGVHT